MKGRIFDIQRYSVHDGPGIRTIVFLKGCPLRCAWCSNPESQRFDIHCMEVSGKEKTVGEDREIADILDEVCKDRAYYRRSGGGLTLSGGECLFQPDFARELLKAARERGLHTAIETTAMAEWSAIAALLPYVHLVLLDIKQVDTAKHKAFTGADNQRILENARKIAESNTPLIIRVPVVPGFNATPGEIRAIAAFAASLPAAKPPGVRELHLLPYHRLGENKYAGLQREYAYAEILPPTDETMRQLREEVEKEGLLCRIGG